MTTGAAADAAWIGDRSPAKAHTCCLTTDVASLIAANTRSASAASRSIVRDTVGLDATRPNTPGSDRSKPGTGTKRFVPLSASRQTLILATST